MRPSSIIIPILFGVFLFAVLVAQLNADFGAEQLETQLALTTLRHAAGLFLAAAAGLFLLIRAVAGDAPGRLIGLVLPVLAGALLTEPSWGVAIGLAAATVGLALRPALGGYSRRMPLTPPPHVPPAL